MRRRRPHLRRDRRGAAALEFALVGGVFLGLTLFAVQAAYLLYAQTALDEATLGAARQLQTGAAKPGSPETFRSNVFCALLGSLLPCGAVSLTLSQVGNYLTGGTVAPGTYDPGASGSLMLMQAQYAPSWLMWPLAGVTLGSQAPYRNEFP